MFNRKMSNFKIQGVLATLPPSEDHGCSYVAQNVDGKNCGPKNVVAKTDIFYSCPSILSRMKN